MKKKAISLFLALCMIMSFATTAYAAIGCWQQDANGWRWIYTEWPLRSYPGGAVNEWKWIDGDADGIYECYYFDENCYCLTDCITPDGYYVNEEGKWTVDGVVQSKPFSTWLAGDNRSPLFYVIGSNEVPPVYDPYSVDEIVLNDELIGLMGTNVDDFFDKKSLIKEYADDWIDYSVTYRGKDLTLETSGNRINSYIGKASQIFKNLPAQGIELNAFYDNIKFPSDDIIDRYPQATTGRSDWIFGYPTATYRYASINFDRGNTYDHVSVLVTQGNDGKYYIFPDNTAFLS